MCLTSARPGTNTIAFQGAHSSARLSLRCCCLPQCELLLLVLGRLLPSSAIIYTHLRCGFLLFGSKHSLQGACPELRAVFARFGCQHVCLPWV